MSSAVDAAAATALFAFKQHNEFYLQHVSCVASAANRQGSRSTAIKSFEAFLTTQSIIIAEARIRIAEDTTSRSLYIILDKFGWSLATKDGR